MFALFYLGWNSALTVGGLTFERIDLLITLLAAAATFIVLRAVALRVRDVLLNRSLMWCYAVLLAIGSSVSLPDEYGLVSMVMEGVLVGVPFACMLAAWGRALGARSHGESSRGVLLATAVAAVFTFLLAVACTRFPLAAAVANLLPFGSAWALGGIEPLLSSERGEGSAAAQKPSSFTFSTLFASGEQRVETHRISRKVVGGSVVFGLAGGLMETYASGSRQRRHADVCGNAAAFGAVLRRVVAGCGLFGASQRFRWGSKQAVGRRVPAGFAAHDGGISVHARP